MPPLLNSHVNHLEFEWLDKRRNPSHSCTVKIIGAKQLHVVANHTKAWRHLHVLYLLTPCQFSNCHLPRVFSALYVMSKNPSFALKFAYNLDIKAPVFLA